MIVEYIRYRTHRGDALEAAYQSARAQLDASPHCLAYELTRCVDEPAVYILRIEWDSADGHLRGFRKSEHFPPFLDAIRPFIDEIEEMRHYALTPVRSA